MSEKDKRFADQKQLYESMLEYKQSQIDEIEKSYKMKIESMDKLKDFE